MKILVFLTVLFSASLSATTFRGVVRVKEALYNWKREAYSRVCPGHTENGLNKKCRAFYVQLESEKVRDAIDVFEAAVAVTDPTLDLMYPQSYPQRYELYGQEIVNGDVVILEGDYDVVKKSLNNARLVKVIDAQPRLACLSPNGKVRAYFYRHFDGAHDLSTFLSVEMMNEKDRWEMLTGVYVPVSARGDKFVGTYVRNWYGIHNWTYELMNHGRTGKDQLAAIFPQPKVELKTTLTLDRVTVEARALGHDSFNGSEEFEVKCEEVK